VGDVIQGTIRTNTVEKVRLVRGSHIVTKRLYDHDKAYFFQGADGRIIFSIPYEQDFTLIGTTDQDHQDPTTPPKCSEDEKNYLLDFANQYFQQTLTHDDIVWTYSGIRPLYDDGASSASAATRDYVLKVDAQNDLAVLNVFGGKITTYRRLAESALEQLQPFLPGMTQPWTAGVTLPGGAFGSHEVGALIAKLSQDYPFLDQFWATRMIRSYGTEAWDILGNAKNAHDLGEDFGASLTEIELKWLIKNEFAVGVDDVIWRRSKLGLRLSQSQIGRISTVMESLIS
jgi:glycerol-3-phosphate dehydrogenase